MIDIHNHILPGVDDGADSMSTSLMMAAMAADDGIQSIVVTPHINWDGEDIQEKQAFIQMRAEELRKELEEAHIPMTFYIGAEVLCLNTKDYPPNVNNFPCINGTTYALVEFQFNAKEDVITEHLLQVLHGGLHPIVAHPERYAAVQKRKTLMEDWHNLGCLLQLNKNSINGSFGWRGKKVAEWALQKKLADFIATDAHDMERRTTRCIATLDKLKSKYGSSYIKKITETNPQIMLTGKPVR